MANNTVYNSYIEFDSLWAVKRKYYIMDLRFATAYGIPLKEGKKRFTKKEKTLIDSAYNFAKDAHEAIDHKRKYTYEPYFDSHCVSVAQLVKCANVYTAEMIAAAYLHDTIEDTHVTFPMIYSEFGIVVAGYVLALSDKSVPEDGNRATRKKIDREGYEHVPNAIKTIKLADVISNALSIVESDKNFARVYIEEMELLLPILKGGDTRLFNLATAIIGHAREMLDELEEKVYAKG